MQKCDRGIKVIVGLIGDIIFNIMKSRRELKGSDSHICNAVLYDT